MILNNKTTLPREVKHHSGTNATGHTVIAAPGAGKTITIVDIINADPTNKLLLKETDSSGDTLASVPPATFVSFNAPVEAGENLWIYGSTSTDYTITYIVG